MIFHSLETRCNEIRSMADRVGSQIVGLTDSKRHYSSLSLRHGTPLPSSPAAPHHLRTLRYQQAGLRGTLAARPAAHEHYLVVEASHVRFPPITDKGVWQIGRPGSKSVEIG